MNNDLIGFLNQEFQVDERVEVFKKHRLYNAEIELTDGCCLSCNYCYVSSQQLPTHTLKLEIAKKIIDSLIDYGLTHFWWGGGEPLLNPNWREILKYAKEKGATENLIFTNALLLTKDACQNLCKLADRVTVHLDTTREHTFRRIQINKNKSREFHKTILMGIDNLLDAGFNNEKIRWNITLTRTILPDLEDTLIYAIHKKRVRTVVLIPLFNCGRAEKVYQKEKLSLSELEYAFTLRAKIEKRPFLLKLGPSEFCKQYQLTCFAINAKGDVLPYVDCFKSVGNIYHENVSDIIEKHFIFLSLKELVSDDTFRNIGMHGKCNGCENERYCFGNPTMIQDNRSSLCDSDPYCWHKSSLEIQNKNERFDKP